jgi:hypothetical protein
VKEGVKLLVFDSEIVGGRLGIEGSLGCEGCRENGEARDEGLHVRGCNDLHCSARYSPQLLLGQRGEARKIKRVMDDSKFGNDVNTMTLRFPRLIHSCFVHLSRSYLLPPSKVFKHIPALP